MNSLAPLTNKATNIINSIVSKQFPTAKPYNRTTENVPSSQGTGVKVSHFVTDIVGLCQSCNKSINDCHMIDVTAFRGSVETTEYYIRECGCEQPHNTWSEVTR